MFTMVDLLSRQAETERDKYYKDHLSKIALIFKLIVDAYIAQKSKFTINPLGDI